MRQEDLDEYILFRHRLRELLHLWRAWATYGKLPEDDPDREITATIAIAAQVWLHSFFDPKGLNVLRLWPRVFPPMKPRIRAWKAKHKDVLKLLEDFRHTTGAHFSRKIEKHNRVRETFDNQRIAKATEAFMEIAREVLKHESEQPELVEATKRYGLPPPMPSAGESPEH